MTSHDTYRERLLDLAYGELERGEARALRAHLDGCAECRAELERISATRSAMSTLRDEPAPDRGEAVLLAAAREAVRERQPRPFVPSWVWGVSVGAVGVAAVLVLTLRFFDLQRGVTSEPTGTELVGGAPERPAVPAPPPLVHAPPAAEQARPADEQKAPAASAELADVRSAGEPGARNVNGQVAKKDATTPARRTRSEPPAEPKPKLARRDDGAAAVAGAVRRRGDDLALDEAPAADADLEAHHGPAAEKPAAPAPSVRLGTKEAPRESVASAAAAPPQPATAPAPEREFTQPPPAGAPAAQLQDGVQDRLEERDRVEATPAPAKRRGHVAAGEGAKLARSKAEAPQQDPVAWYQRLQAAGKLRATTATYSDCPGESSRVVERDEQGRVVKVTRRGVRGGARHVEELYYAEDGALALAREDGAPAGVNAPAPPRTAAEAASGAPRCGE